MRVIGQHAFWVCLLAALTRAFAAGTASAPTTALPAPSPWACSYDIAATLNADGSIMSAVAQITCRNNGPDALEELVFHFQPSQDGQAADLSPPTVRYLGDETTDLPLKTSRFTRDGSAMKDHFVVHLPKPLTPGETVRLQTTSQCRIGDRWGMKNVEGSWHPRIVHRSKGVWQPGRDAFADYRATTGPLPFEQIPVSGPIVDRRKDATGRWIITSEATNIPDFAMVFSKVDFCVSDSQDGVAIQCFYDKPEDKGAAERMLAAAKDIIPFYRGLYGYYPDRVLNIVVFDGNGFGGGPFGSNILQVNNTFERDEDSTIWAIAHEIAHMYWGWNRTTDANPRLSWLCLGMGLWTDRQYIDARKKDGQHGNILAEYTSAAEKGLNTKLLGVTAADRKNRMDENPLAHGKGYQIVLELEYLFGTDTVNTIAQKTLERYAHQPIEAKDFQAVCQEVTGQDLEWFFREWLYTSDCVDFVLQDVTATQQEAVAQFTVSIKPKGGIAMPVDVMLEYADGSNQTQRLDRSGRQATFVATQPWRRAIVDPGNRLPDVNRADNLKANPAVPPAFEILDVDLGDKAWGLNLLKVHVRNRTGRERTLFLHIGGRVGRPGFGQGKAHLLAAGEDSWIEHWYWVPPGHGTSSFTVTFTDPTGGPEPWNDPPFLRKTYAVDFPTPNDRCNDLVISHKLPRSQYRDVRPMEPLKYLVTEHFVFYSSPGTPAYEDREALAKEHEAALAEAGKFLGVRPQDKIVMFFYPDPVTKRMCTGHTGDGYAEGNTIVEVYNKDVHLDPLHEITHIVAGQSGAPPALFCEGLAVWMQKEHAWQGQSVDVTARELMNDGRLVPLAKLLERTEIGAHGDDGKVAYPQSASLVGFLINTFGKEQFLQAYKVLQNSNDPQEIRQNVSRMRDVFGMSLEEMENTWKASLLRTDAEEQSPPEG